MGAAEQPREVRGLAVADETGDLRDRQRRLAPQQLGRDRHTPREQILAEARFGRRVRALDLPRRAGELDGERTQRQRLGVADRDDLAAATIKRGE